MKFNLNRGAEFWQMVIAAVVVIGTIGGFVGAWGVVQVQLNKMEQVELRIESDVNRMEAKLDYSLMWTDWFMENEDALTDAVTYLDQAAE